MFVGAAKKKISQTWTCADSEVVFTRTNAGNAKARHADWKSSGAPETAAVGAFGARLGFNRSFDDQQQEPTPSTFISSAKTVTSMNFKRCLRMVCLACVTAAKWICKQSFASTTLRPGPSLGLTEHGNIVLGGVRYLHHPTITQPVIRGEELSSTSEIQHSACRENVPRVQESNTCSR